jgi:Domain of unknown function (DUF4430)
VRVARILAAALALCAAAAAGCGLGPGKDQGDVSLTVTRDYGSKVLLQKTDSINESDTVFRVLDRNADVSTRYGGGFVQSVNGLAGSQSGGRSSDWFFYVNGIESPIGSAQYDVSGGDRIWWDYRDWTAAMRVPAVVGSWPEPFVHGFQDKRYSTDIACDGSPEPCSRVAAALRSAGVGAVSQGNTGEKIEVFVGPWSRIASESTPHLLFQGPDRSGVFARFVGTKTPLLELLDQQGQPAGSIGKGGGLIAALRPGDGPPTWVVTGTDAKGVAAAANLLGADLRDHYAVATEPGARAIGVPVQ